ncbi:hypothetical protein PFISCL1PPCAC_21733, partial [Pristionchus fissidentatus]
TSPKSDDIAASGITVDPEYFKDHAQCRWLPILGEEGIAVHKGDDIFKDGIRGQRPSSGPWCYTTDEDGESVPTRCLPYCGAEGSYATTTDKAFVPHTPKKKNPNNPKATNLYFNNTDPYHVNCWPVAEGLTAKQREAQAEKLRTIGYEYFGTPTATAAIAQSQRCRNWRQVTSLQDEEFVKTG